MTFKELYEWAVERGIEYDELLLKVDSDGIFPVTEEVLSPSFRTDNTTINLTEEYKREF